MQRTLNEIPDVCLDEINLLLRYEHNVFVDIPTLYRTLERMGYSRKILQKSAQERNIERRAAWWEEITQFPNSISHISSYFLTRVPKMRALSNDDTGELFAGIGLCKLLPSSAGSDTLYYRHVSVNSQVGRAAQTFG